MLTIMPAKNVIKEYREGAYYHVYNRGVDKGLIFRQDHDYKTFLSYLKIYLSLQGESSQVAPSKKLKNYCDDIDSTLLLSYAQSLSLTPQTAFSAWNGPLSAIAYHKIR